MPITEILQKMIDNPEDLTELPGVIERIRELEENYSASEEKIGELHTINRKYLSMIPIKDETKKEEEEPKHEEITVDDAVNSIMGRGEDR